MRHEPTLRFFWKLFWTTLVLSAFTFGGGFVIISLMRKKMVQELKWISDEEMMDFVTIAQSSPGPIAVNGSLIAGYHLAGFPGALVATFGTVLPPMVILSLVSLGYGALQSNPWIAAAFHGMRPVVAAIVLEVTWSLFKPLAADKKALPLAVLGVSFAALYFFKVNIMLVIALCLLLSIAISFHNMRKGAK